MADETEPRSDRQGPNLWTVLLALFLVAVPTYFTLFPKIAEGHHRLRVVVLILWIAAAVGAARSATQQGQTFGALEAYLSDIRKERADIRFVAGAAAIRVLLSNLPSSLAEHEFRLFLFDAKLGRLKPSYEPGTGSGQSHGWAPGQGASGQAYAINEYVSVRGPACSDGTYDLLPEQQERYRNLAVVAAMPVRNFRNQCIGVLTGSADEDDGRLVSPEGQGQHIELALVVARIMIDVLQLASD